MSSFNHPNEHKIPPKLGVGTKINIKKSWDLSTNLFRPIPMTTRNQRLGSGRDAALPQPLDGVAAAAARWRWSLILSWLKLMQ